MKRIRIGLSVQSVNKAIYELEKIKNDTLKTMIIEFLKRTCEWIINRANSNVENSGRGSDVIEDIKSSWHYSINERGKAEIINSAEKAVYVEFGVGVVGQRTPHPNADEAGYDYNRDSNYKDYGGSWHFFSNESELDIPLSSIEWGLYPSAGDARQRLSVYTSGAKGDMFLYNAMMDYVSSGTVYTIWKDVKEKYLV